METVFPTETGYAGFFLVGWRKNPASTTEIQQVGTIVLKRSYTIDPNTNPALGMLTPMDEPLPVFEQDVAENLTLNGDMEASQKAFGEGDSVTLPGAWQVEADATAVLAQDQGRQGTDDTGLQVTGKTTNSRVVQTISFDLPLGGRPFSLSLYAKADAATTTNNIRLEADGATVCSLNAALTTAHTRFTATGVWPMSVTVTEMQVVLPMVSDSARTVFYDDVEVLERSYKTKVGVAALRYESDLTPFKPEGDVVVLDYAAQSGVNRVRVNGSNWLARTVSSNGSGRDKALFGWEPRAVNPRKGEAAFPEDDSAYPLPEALPGGFNNRFYNGYLRGSLQLTTLPYLSATANVEIERNGSVDYAFHLPGESVTAVYYVYSGTGPDKDSYWQSHTVTLNLDTLVIEPEHNRCYTVWRGVWPFTDHPEDAYRRLVVKAV